MAKKIYPLKNFILTKPVEAEKKTIDGLILPDTIEESATLRRVEVIQTEEETPKQITIGTILIVPSNLRNEVKIDGVSHFLVHVEEVLAYEA